MRAILRAEWDAMEPEERNRVIAELVRDYGGSFGPLRWRYDLGTACNFARDVQGRELRWYGMNIPYLGLAFGFIRSVPLLYQIRKPKK